MKSKKHKILAMPKGYTISEIAVFKGKALLTFEKKRRKRR